MDGMRPSSGAISCGQAEEAEIALARSMLYRLLSYPFGYPDPHDLEAYRSGRYLELVSEALRRIPHLRALPDACCALRAAAAELESVSHAEFEVEFVRTLDVGSPRPPCPPYEGYYRAGESRTAVLVRVSEFYRHFGLAMAASEDGRELPDHIRAELEFMHYLCFKEGQAVQEANAELRDGYRRAQRDFLSRHLAEWLPLFRDRLASRGSLPLLTRAADLVCRVVEGEAAWSSGRERGQGPEGSPS